MTTKETKKILLEMAKTEDLTLLKKFIKDETTQKLYDRIIEIEPALNMPPELCVSEMDELWKIVEKLSGVKLGVSQSFPGLN